MKKFMIILSVLIITCGTKIVSFAAPADSDGWESDVAFNTVMDTFTSAYNITMPDSIKSSIWNYGYNPQDDYYFFFQDGSSYIYMYFYQNVTIASDNNAVSCTSPGFAYYYEKSTGAYLANTVAATWNFNISDRPGIQMVGRLSDLVILPDGVDYSIPVPSASIVYASRIYEGDTLDDLSSWIYLNNPNVNLNNLYVEIQYKYYTPSKLGVTPNNFGDSQFNVIEYTQSEVYNSITLVSKTKLSDLTSVNNGEKYKAILDDNNLNWLNFFNDNRYNIDYYNTTTSDLLINAENYFAVNRFKAQRDMLPGAFNVMEVFVRYYRIDGSQIKLGQWLHMKNDTTLDQQALNVSIPIINPPISTSVSDDIELPDDTNSIGTGVWLPSISTDLNITINMPEQNTLNYPTIVTYNHDIAFRQYAETARNIPNFFTNATNFAKMAFSFIPDEVWAIISMGLLLSIGVMVIKIL